MKGVISLVSFSVHLSFVYRRATDFCELILYPATLLKVFINCMNSLIELLESLMYNITSTANNDTFTSFSPICFPLISFDCPIVLAKTSSTILNRQLVSEQPYLVPDFRGIALSFSPLI